MSSPITGDDFPDYSPSADACVKLEQLLSSVDKIKTWFEWAFDSAGNWTEEAMQQIVLAGSPVGTIILWPGSTLPSDKWQICNGGLLSRTTYSDLFDKIGTVFGAGDGVTTFKIPDLSSRMPVGVGTDALGATGGERNHELTTAELPAHSHVVPITQKIAGNTGDGGQDIYAQNTNGSSTNLTDSELTSEETGGDSGHNNMPPYLGLYFIIRAKP